VRVASAHHRNVCDKRALCCPTAQDQKLGLIFGQWRFAKGLAHPNLVVGKGKKGICFRKSP
jgi:hypothetical protein